MAVTGVTLLGLARTLFDAQRIHTQYRYMNRTHAKSPYHRRIGRLVDKSRVQKPRQLVFPLVIRAQDAVLADHLSLRLETEGNLFPWSMAGWVVEDHRAPAGAPEA